LKELKAMVQTSRLDSSAFDSVRADEEGFYLIFHATLAGDAQAAAYHRTFNGTIFRHTSTVFHTELRN